MLGWNCSVYLRISIRFSDATGTCRSDCDPGWQFAISQIMAEPQVDPVSEDWDQAAGTASRLQRVVRDVLLVLALIVLACGIGIFWIDATVPGAWPDLIGPTSPTGFSQPMLPARPPRTSPANDAGPAGSS
jgi:hypothetical protein